MAGDLSVLVLSVALCLPHNKFSIHIHRIGATRGRALATLTPLDGASTFDVGMDFISLFCLALELVENQTHCLH